MGRVTVPVSQAVIRMGNLNQVQVNCFGAGVNNNVLLYVLYCILYKKIWTTRFTGK